MTFTFLALALGLLVIPLIFQVDKNIFGKDSFRSAMVASFIATMLLGTVSVVLAKFSVISYPFIEANGLVFQRLPLVQYLLHFTFGFTAIAVYQYLNIRFKNNNLQKYSLATSHFLMGLCIAFLFFGYTKLFTLVTFSILFLALFAVEYMSKLRFMYRTYRTFLVMLILGFALYAILIAEGILKINYLQTVRMDLLGVPLEQHFLVLLNTVVAVNMFEFFKVKITV